MDDALRVLQAVGRTGRDVVVGHDWGAMAAAGLAALPDGPFAKSVLMSVPPARACWPQRGGGLRRSLPVQLPAQAIRFWYIGLPWLPERSRSWLIPLLWRRWSPSYRAGEDLRHVANAIAGPANFHAAINAYRLLVRPGRLPREYAQLQPHFSAAPLLPTWYLHGAECGCMGVDLAHRVPAVLPAGSATQIVERAGHFMAVEQPAVVARHILGFIGAAR